MDALDERLAQVSAVLLEDRILRRVIKRHRRLHGVGLQVPHAACYAVPRGDLERLVDRDELHIDPAKLPERVVVFRGSRDALVAGSGKALTQAWRHIFHGKIHQRFDELFAKGALTAAAIRERVHRIGQAEFDEIRFVLRQEDLLLPPVDDTGTYVEFVALYLELATFAPRSLPRTFPTLSDHAEAVEDTIALDLDVAELLAASRPPGAPERPLVEASPLPVATVTSTAPREIVVEPSARKGAAAAREKGNRARAAILCLRAGDDDAAHRDLVELAERLARALGAGPSPAPSGSVTRGGGGSADATGWAEALMPVARYAAGQRVLRFDASARLLHDLQSACVVADREEKKVDVVAWALSLRKVPIVRALPATRVVRVAKHLHVAQAKVAQCGVATLDDRDRLSRALHQMVEHAEAQVRAQLRPKIEAALDDVDLNASHLPEIVARKKLIDELLDQAVEVGRLSLGNLRDAISHNDLKMVDLRAAQLRRGDQILRADAALSRSLDGVYHRGESYLRFLQKLSSVFFGTPVGRVVSKYILLPLLAAYAALEGVQHIVGPIVKYGFHREEPEIATNGSIAGFAVFLFFVLHAPPFRRAVVFVLRYTGKGLRLVLWDMPRFVLGLSIVRALLASRFARWVLEPAIPAAIAYAVLPGWLGIVAAAGLFALTALALNSRVGRRVNELVTDWLVRSGRHLLKRIAPGLVKYVLDAFRELIELMNRGIYRVDEALRFKTGQSSLMLVVKGVLGTLWFILTYFLRLYVNLFIEPVINPIKHFPTVTVAAKILLPFSPNMISGITAALGGGALAGSFAAFTVFVIPGFAGFLVWELKENWKLYRASRPPALRDVAIGHHGETMGAFMKPGFHSGTIPKLYGKLRRAAWKGDEHAVARHRDGLHHVEEAIWKFADRELVSILSQPAAGFADLAVHHVDIGSNRVRIELACDAIAPARATIAFEEQSGWLVAGMPELGWVGQLDAKRRAVFELALGGFYKLAGVEIVRAQLEAVLRDGDARAPAYDISAEGLVVWPGQGYQSEIVYDLTSRSLSPPVRGSEPVGKIPSFAGRHALFGREPISWTAWESAWDRLADGGEPTRIAVGPSLLG